ncbi:hypothetical protein H7R52_16830 [Weissella confusa]|uniref:Uncharacterized protein n=1 Tax=Weissella confusa TaxID=1583 RepID=A0A923SP29_WEICO|nr:hypothetical protein [Weissella confusa]
MDWQKQTVRAVKYIARGFNWQFDLVGEKADVVKRWIRDDKQRTIMIRMQLSNGKLLKKLYNYEGDSLNMTENESYRNGFPGEYLMYRIAGIRLRPATYLNDLPFKPDYAMSYNKYGEISVTDMGNEVATLQLHVGVKRRVQLAVNKHANTMLNMFRLSG